MKIYIAFNRNVIDQGILLTDNKYNADTNKTHINNDENTARKQMFIA